MIPADFAVSSIAAGSYGHSLVLSEQGEVLSFGWCEDGQCGHLGLKEDILIPHKISSLRNITSICGGYKHTVVIRGGAKLLAFGDSFFGQLGPARSAVKTTVDSLDENSPSATETTEIEKEEPVLMVADNTNEDGDRL